MSSKEIVVRVAGGGIVEEHRITVPVRDNGDCSFNIEVRPADGGRVYVVGQPYEPGAKGFFYLGERFDSDGVTSVFADLGELE